ncbi:MAG TPA: hypothetical protein VN448_01565 [Gammaproteobacteria bacterium]|nr:hypothetical protein [Gammaproteobacteria bacterium]
MRFASTSVISTWLRRPKPGGEFQAASFPPTMTSRGARTRLGVVEMRGT